MQSLEKIYREACLLDMKYKHLSDACESLLQPWPNRDVNGHSIKTENTKEGQMSDCQQDVEEVPVCQPDEQVVASAAKDLADLQILDNILSKAQHIREVDRRGPRRTLATMAMATRAYGQTKHPSKKASKSKASRSSSKAASLKTPWQPLHDLAVSSTSTNDDSGLNQTLSSAQSDNTSKGSSKVFLLQAKGQRLTMPSKYIKLQKFLTRLTTQQQVAPHDSHCEGSDHYSQRLLSEECVEQPALIELGLALEEWALVKKELLAITPKEMASVFDKWQDLLGVKTKLESLLARVEENKELSKKRSTAKATPRPPSTTAKATPRPSGRPVLAYVDLERLRQVSLLETQLLHQTWEAAFIDDIERTIIPFIEPTVSSHDTVQCIHRLLGTKPPTTYISVDHQS